MASDIKKKDDRKHTNDSKINLSEHILKTQDAFDNNNDDDLVILSKESYFK